MVELLPDSNSHLYINFLINTSLLKTITGDAKTAAIMGKEALSLSKDLPWFHAPASNTIGHAYLALGQAETARQYYQQAVTSYKNYQQTHLTPEPMAGLARIALLEGKPDQALATIQEFLPALRQGTLQGPDRLLWTYLICYQVLATNNDPQAPEIIQAATQLLSGRAKSIADSKWRQSYLTGVSNHIEINKIWQSLSHSH